MKKFIPLLVLSFFILFSQHLSGLSYVESSNGLTPPSFDGGPTEVEMADINGDGNIDLLSIGDHGSPYVNTNEHGIMVWFGDGQGNWNIYQNGEFGYGGIAIGDVNNDGFLDVGYAMHHNWSGNDFGDQLVEVALGDGTGQNWQPWDDSLADEGQDWGMFGTDFADINNDGLLDIGSNSFGAGDGVHIYINNGDGAWTHTFGFLGGNSTELIQFGDVNNDGNADFVVAHQNGTIYIGDGNGNFTVGDGNLPSGGSMGLYGVALGDINNDGGDDIAFCNSNGGVEVWTMVSQNTWSNVSGTLPSSGSYQATQLYDMNKDGYGDVVAFGNGVLTIWTGDGAGNWTQATSFNTPSPGDFAALRVGGDADHNGYPDIVIVADEGTWPSDINHIRFFKEVETPESLTIHPTYPHGSEKFYAGSVHFIDWLSAIPNNQTSNVRLELSTTGNGGPWKQIAQNLPNNGRYQWVIPDSVSSVNCFIRYTVYSSGNSAECITPTPFEILPSSSIFFTHYGKNNNEQKTRLTLTPSVVSNKTINISYTVKEPCNVRLTIYDITGKIVKNLTNRFYKCGTYTIKWYKKDNGIKTVPQGIYFLRGNIGTLSVTQKIIHIK